ncbi:MAG TPA: hypothetical protein VES65_10195 [Solirubrobacteraceae bacterium]|nr:hypothetical protein [Solirubrobacteraceae bacterium]
MRRRARAILAFVSALCALVLGGCGDTLQDQPIPHNSLESLELAPFPVYWLGASFHGLAITEASRDPGGAFTVQYGDCLRGGQSACVPPLKLITSPDNSFVPGEASPSRSTASLRGAVAYLAEHGAAIAIATDGVVLDVYAHTPALARAAAQAAVPINFPGAPGARLAAPLPDTGFAQRPLPSQTPSPLRALR